MKQHIGTSSNVFSSICLLTPSVILEILCKYKRHQRKIGPRHCIRLWVLLHLFTAGSISYATFSRVDTRHSLEKLHAIFHRVFSPTHSSGTCLSISFCFSFRNMSVVINFNCIEDGINRRSHTGLIDVVNRLPR